MASFEFLAIILTGLGLTASIIYYASILRNANKTQQLQLETRQAQLFMQVYDRWNSSEFINFWFKFSSTDLDKYEFGTDKELDVAFRAIGRFMEGIGVLVKRKLIDVEFVDDLMSGNIIEFWESSKEWLIDFRTQTNYPQYGEWVEYLYNQIKPIVEQQYPETAK